MQKKRSQALPALLMRSLPLKVLCDYESILKNVNGSCEEIRLRLGRRSEFVFSGTSILGSSIADEIELRECFYKLCGGSVYAHSDEICYGGMRAEGGIRVGACGRAVVRGGSIEAVHEITSLNIRLPCTILPEVGELSRMIAKNGCGVLLFSKPGVGKTTVLKAIAHDISGKYGKRVALIDSGGELFGGLSDENLKLDILEGYPRGVGIEIAVRAMNPQFIVCDEIGSRSEASALLSAVGCGVPIIASAHGDDVSQLVRRPGICELHDAGIFERYIHLERGEGKTKCDFNIIKREDISEKNDTS